MEKRKVFLKWRVTIIWDHQATTKIRLLYLVSIPKNTQEEALEALEEKNLDPSPHFHLLIFHNKVTLPIQKTMLTDDTTLI